LQTILLLKSAFLCVSRFFGLSSFDTVTTLILSRLASFLPFFEVIPEIFCNFARWKFLIINKKATYMFDNLSERLERSFKILKGEGKITEINVAETLKDVRRALLDADVNYKVAKNFTDTVKEKALGQNVLTAVKPSQLMVKIVHDELTTLMGGDTAEIELKGRPAVILMSGLQGSGKTTFSGKLARMMKSKKNRKPLLVACDVYRPAAIEQLKVLGQQVEVPVYSELDSKDPVQIALNAIQEAKAKGYDLVIVDTAGRLAIDEQMMNEIEAIKKAINPDATLFVVDAMTGQDAVNTAREFNERLDFTGVVLTKLDGDTRGGAALSIRTVVNKPIMFVGTGEKLDAVDQFHPARMADRILGMGDIVSLVERAQEQYDEEEAKRLQKKIQKNQFDFNDFLTQIHQIKKMGNLKELASMIPGVGKAIKDIDIDDNAFKSIEAIIYSMTPEERTHPEILNGTRRTRIAKGSGTSIQEVNRLLKQFDQTRKMMKMVTGSKMAGMMQKMKKK
jgi:signal recognition particle subunit SRP54